MTESSPTRSILSSIRSARNWIIFLLIALIVMDVALFFVYSGAHPKEDIYTQAWTFLSSDLFKLATISLFIPLITLYIEHVFGLNKNLSERVEEIRKTNQARQQKEEDAAIEANWKAVEQTSKVWCDFVNISHDARFLKQGLDASAIDDYERKRLKSLSDLFDVVNTWHYWFPTLDYNNNFDFTGSIIYFMNTLYSVTDSVIYQAKRGSDRKTLEEFQIYLLPITTGIHGMVYHPMLTVLKNTVALKKYGENQEMDDEARKIERIRRKQIEGTIQENLEILKNKANFLLKNELTNNTIFPSFGNKETTYEPAAKKIIDLGNGAESSKELIELEKKFRKASPDYLRKASETGCSLKWARFLATWFIFDDLKAEILERAKLSNENPQ